MIAALVVAIATTVAAVKIYAYAMVWHAAHCAGKESRVAAAEGMRANAALGWRLRHDVVTHSRDRCRHLAVHAVAGDDPVRAGMSERVL